MSTRAVYTFIDKNDTFHVYKHFDGYPSGAIDYIENAIKLAWKLPRFEACEFGAAFISANKLGNGSVYLTHDYKNHSDLSYRYEIRLNSKDEIQISCFEYPKNKEVFCGTVDQMKDWINKENIS